ncbi:MAG TPA: sensor domain-containing protein [Mycobacterium sp.]|nr:sensor domain-containing protein [Mycobacterium sp.]
MPTSARVPPLLSSSGSKNLSARCAPQNGLRLYSATQAVVAFAAADAQKLLADQTAQWSACHTIPTNLADQPGPQNWTLSPSAATDATLSISLLTEGGHGWSCQLALGIRNNIAVDVLVCRYDVTNQGVMSSTPSPRRSPGRVRRAHRG